MPLRILISKKALASGLIFICIFCFCQSAQADDRKDYPECVGREERLVEIGNAEWHRRGLNNTQDAISRQRVELSIDCFSKASKNSPQNLDLSLKLIEALYFLGHFISTEQQEKELIFQEALDLSKTTLENLKVRTARKDLFSLPLQEQAELLKSMPEAPRAIFWASITWGLWGMTFGDLQAALNDVAGKCAMYSELLILLDSKYADGGGYRLLGRLHTVVPRIPLFTLWINRQKGISLLEQAVAISTSDPRNQFFLADAILKFNPERREFAIGLLDEVSSLAVSGDYLIEKQETVNQARQLLKEIKK